MKRWQIIIIIFIMLSLALLGMWGASLLYCQWDEQLSFANTVIGYFWYCATIALTIMVWLKRFEIRRWFRKTHFEHVGELFDVREENVTAVVIPVSRREQPEWIIRWLRPRYIALLYTEKTRSEAKNLLADFSDDKMEILPNQKAIDHQEYMLDDPDDPKEARRLTKLFIQQFIIKGVPLREIFVDTTGGKVPMSIGAFQAAEEMNVSSIYISGNLPNGHIEDPRLREQGKPIFISDHTV